jgi:hypothetical protein
MIYQENSPEPTGQEGEGLDGDLSGNRPSLPRVHRVSSQILDHFDASLLRDIVSVRERQAAGEVIPEQECKRNVIVVSEEEGLEGHFASVSGLSGVREIGLGLYSAVLDLREAETVAADPYITIVEKEGISYESGE